MQSKIVLIGFLILQIKIQQDPGTESRIDSDKIWSTYIHYFARLNMFFQTWLKIKVCLGNMRVSFLSPISSLQPVSCKLWHTFQQKFLSKPFLSMFKSFSYAAHFDSSIIFYFFFQNCLIISLCGLELILRQKVMASFWIYFQKLLRINTTSAKTCQLSLIVCIPVFVKDAFLICCLSSLQRVVGLVWQNCCGKWMWNAQKVTQMWKHAKHWIVIFSFFSSVRSS